MWASKPATTPSINSHAACTHWVAQRVLMLQVLECYALNEPPPEEVNDGTKPDDEGMQKNMEAIIGFRVSRPVFMLGTMPFLVRYAFPSLKYTLPACCVHLQGEHSMPHFLASPTSIHLEGTLACSAVRCHVKSVSGTAAHGECGFASCMASIAGFWCQHSSAVVNANSCRSCLDIQAKPQAVTAKSQTEPQQLCWFSLML